MSHQWNYVLFTDESHFSVTSAFQCCLIWREVGTWFYPTNIGERDRFLWCTRLLRHYDKRMN